MNALYLCIGFGLIFGYARVSALTDYALHFPTKGVTDFVNIWGMPSLTQFTVCLWMKSNDSSNKGTPFSYAVPGSDNALLIENYKNFNIIVMQTSTGATSVSANDGKWHHICVSWENTQGKWKIYKDGAVAASGTALNTGVVIKSGGSLVLAQEQDSPGGGFDINQSVLGMLTNVNVWDHVVPLAQIEQMSKSCLSGEGNVYKWSDFIHGRQGKARVVIPSPCKPLAA